MNETLQSILVGTAGLSVAVVASFWLALTRPLGDVGSRTVNIAAICLAVHCLHFTEEYFAGFNERFPNLLGLPAWPVTFFVVFNLSLIGIWLLSIYGLRQTRWYAIFPVWFLALGSAVNGVAHPVMAILSEGYFPGLVTSPIAGLAGILLIRALWRDSNRCPN